MEYNIVILKILILIGCSAFFAGMEVAFLSSDKLMVELAKEKTSNILQIKALDFLLKKPSYIIGTALVFATISMVLFSSYVADLFHKNLFPLLPTYFKNEFILLFLETLLITIITLLFIEFIPKSIVIIDPNRFLYLFAIPIAFLSIILYPIIAIIIYISKFMLIHIFRQKFSEGKTEFGLKDFHSFLKKNIDAENKNPTLLRARMASNVIKFKNARIRDCMIPRTEIIAIEEHASLDKIQEKFVSCEHSRILVYNNKIDDIIGFYKLKDILQNLNKPSTILYPILIFPETCFASDVLTKFIEKNQSIALVVDEFGGTAGIITFEDIVEEIIGEIKDEHDTENLISKRLSDNTFIVSARTEINVLNEKYNLNIPTGEYDTLGGYIINIAGKIPQNNEIIKNKNYKFLIISIKSSYIETVKIVVKNT